MNSGCWTTWRRDLLVAALASLLTAGALVPIGWSAVRAERARTDAIQEMAEALRQRAEQRPADLDLERIKAQRALLEQAADFTGFGDKSEAEVLHVTTRAVSPEVPKDAHLLIDKKATTYAIGDIVIYRVEDNNYLGRVVALSKDNTRLTLGRNGEPNREVAVSAVVGRGVLNTR
jgi:hypothetical protein